MKQLLSNTTIRLFISVVVGILIGLFANETVISIVLPLKHVLGQIIFFLIPLLIFGFITPAIARLKNNASKLLGKSVLLAYLSCIGSASLAAFLGYTIIPLLNIAPTSETVNTLPEMIFRLDIPPLMPVLSALVFAFMLGLSIIWTKSPRIEKALFEFQDIIFIMVRRFLIPILPFFIAANFCILAYEGALASRLPVFAAILGITVLCHITWLTFLYLSAGLYAKVNPLKIIKHYGPVALTAIGTQSSAASLGLAKRQKKSKF